jgi:hypothetical protein
MTITRRPDGVWELRTREGQLAGTGELPAMINLWARMRRDGWSVVPFGDPARGIDGRRTVECTGRNDCACRACDPSAPTSADTIDSLR